MTAKGNAAQTAILASLKELDEAVNPVDYKRAEVLELLAIAAAIRERTT